MINTDVKISGGGYVAEFRSDLGGNCYRLYHEPSGSEILRTPSSDEELFSQVYLFGNPILFPPNRISGASFEFEGRRYEFPLNEPSTGCHIHGELYKKKFSVKEKSGDSVCFFYEAKSGEYIGFPHAFRLERSYKASLSGLEEEIKVVNLSGEDMPFMLAFHTTFNVPFANGSSGEEAYLECPVGKEHIRNEKFLPTLEYVGGRARENELSDGTYRIYSSSLSAFYESEGNTALVADRENGGCIVYEASEEYKYRMLWRKDGAKFVVIEPQTAAIDCFHLEAPAEEKGLIAIAPGESVTLKTRFAYKSLEKHN